MIPGLGAYYRPERLEDALHLLREEPRARVLAGGTDLLLESEPVHALVDVSRLGLDTIHQDENGLVLGATASIENVLRSDAARGWADGVLVGACLNFGTLQVRNMATVGGNVAHALPAADLVPAMMALDAQVQLVRTADDGGLRRRHEPLAGFATAPFETKLAAGELIVEVRIPAATRSWRAQFRKIGRVLKDLAQVNCAVALDLDGSHLRQARIVLGAVHPVVTRVESAERELLGADCRSGEWVRRCEHAVQAVRDFIRPISDVRASAEWRRHVCGVLVQRSLDFATRAETAGRVPCYDDGPLDRFGLDTGGVP
jgi:CO/xanthine dehydrogenase FAD-binding subunit